MAPHDSVCGPNITSPSSAFICWRCAERITTNTPIWSCTTPNYTARCCTTQRRYQNEISLSRGPNTCLRSFMKLLQISVSVTWNDGRRHRVSVVTRLFKSQTDCLVKKTVFRRGKKHSKGAIQKNANRIYICITAGCNFEWSRRTERMIRSIENGVRMMLLHFSVSKTFWAERVYPECNVCGKVVREGCWRTSDKLSTGERPTVVHIRAFWYKV